MNEAADFYKPLKTLSLLAIAGLAAVGVFDLLQLLFSFGEAISPESVFEVESGRYMSVWLMLIGVTTVFRFPVFIFTAVVFLMWLSRGYKNLPALRAETTEVSPGWAVGYWFIPILNLFKPFHVVRELWAQSDPEFDEQLGYTPSDYSAPALLSFWWASWIIYNITSNVSNRLIGDNDTNLSAAFLGIFIMSGVFGIVAAILAIVMVKKIAQRQEQRFQRLATLNRVFQSPPPPPAFG